MLNLFKHGFVLYAIFYLCMDSYTEGVRISLQNNLNHVGWFIFAFIVRMLFISILSVLLGMAVTLVLDL